MTKKLFPEVTKNTLLQEYFGVSFNCNLNGKDNDK